MSIFSGLWRPYSGYLPTRTQISSKSEVLYWAYCSLYLFHGQFRQNRRIIHRWKIFHRVSTAAPSTASRQNLCREILTFRYATKARIKANCHPSSRKNPIYDIIRARWWRGFHPGSQTGFWELSRIRTISRSNTWTFWRPDTLRNPWGVKVSNHDVGSGRNDQDRRELTT